MTVPGGAGDWRPTWDEVADAVWLMSAMAPHPVPGLEPPPAPAEPVAAEQPANGRPPVAAAAADGTAEPGVPQQDHRPLATRIVVSSVSAGHELGQGRLPAVPDVPPLPGAAGLIRALRPLHRRARSRHDDDIVLDEVATAERAVQDGLWLPVTTTAEQRWLDLTLVVDAGPSMALWESTVAAFETLMGRLGTFRTIQRRLLDLDGSREPLLRGGTSMAPPRSPAELVDPSGRRVVLVLTDGVSGDWQSPAVSAMLSTLAGAMPTAIVHLLPQSLWRGNGLRLHRARLRPRGRGAPNSTWSMVLPDDWLEPDFAAPTRRRGVPVPVLELTERWFRGLVQLLVGFIEPVDMPVLLAGESVGDTPPEQHEPLSPREQVTRFLSTASPIAFRLATLLAAVPVSLRIARLIQRQIVPEAGTEHLAEVLGSDLFEPDPAARADTPTDQVTFQVRPEIREQLLSGARRSETVRVVRLTASIAGRTGTLGQILAALDDPDGAPDPTTASDRALERTVLKALSGPYLSRAIRLAEVPEPDAPGTVRLPAIWGNVPSRNDDFTGRAEQLHELAAPPASAEAVPSVLHGMGGMGKTQIAVEYVYRHLDDFDLVWWIDASQPSQIRASLAELAQALGLPESVEANAAVPAVREALRGGRLVRRWLLVFDAAADPEALTSFLPAGGAGQVIVTSRNPGWSGTGPRLPVDVFRRPESVELLRRHDPELTDEDGERLAARLGDMPLAVEQAAAWRAESGMPVGEYLRFFDEKLAQVERTAGPADHEVAVAAAWHVAFDELRKRSPAAHQLLQICAFYAAEPISLRLFTDVQDVAIAPELDEALHDPAALGRAVRDIERYGLAEVDHRNGTLRLHRVVQLVLRNQMDPRQRRAIRHAAHLLLANDDVNDPVSTRHWQRYKDLLSHAHQSDLVECRATRSRDLVLNLITFLYRWGDHGEAITLAQWALTQWRVRISDEDPQTLQATGMLGYYYWINGEYARAADLNRRTLAIRRRVDGEDSESTLSAHMAVSRDLRASGDFAGALRLTATVHDRAKKLFGTNDPATLRIARVHCVSLRLVGRYRQAAQLDGDTHRRLADLLGDDHPETLMVYSALILDRREAGEYLWARTEQEKLAIQAREVHGDNNADTLRRLAYLAVARRRAGDRAAALALSTEVVRRFEVRYSGDNFNAIACALGQSIDLRQAGDLDAARRAGEQVVARYRVSMGELHPYVTCAQIDLAVTLRLSGDPAAARAIDEQAVAHLTSVLGPEHPHTIMGGINLASDMAALGDASAALAWTAQALQRAEQSLGADHPITLAAAVNWALDLRSLGREREADLRFADILARLRRVLGSWHPATIGAVEGTRADCDIDPLPI
ncbi:MAG: FxSxx-COOH system tetratricopeptide repeat protein [Kibdelosporangium sp.]